MISWKSILVISTMCTTLLAETKVEAIVGRPILKDKDGQELEIKADSKFTITISPSPATDKLVLKNLFQVKIASDKQEVLLDVTQGPEPKADSAKTKSSTGIYYKASKELNKQDLHVTCFANIDVKEKDIEYETASVEYIKSKSDCKAYTLGENKKFKMVDSPICIAKKEVTISKKVPAYEEKIVCKFYDDSPKTTMGAMVIYTHDLADIQDKQVKPTASEAK